VNFVLIILIHLQELIKQQKENIGFVMILVDHNSIKVMLDANVVTKIE